MGPVVIAFSHERLPQRVQLGTGIAAQALAAEIQRRGTPRVLLIASERASQSVAHGISVVGHITNVQQHVPIESVTTARKFAADARAELLVCIGGGSATGLAKAIALTMHLPIVAIPTTYAGSEATPMWGITEGQRKTTGVASHVLPSSVLYDTELLSGMPRSLSVSSALNAMAHGIDAMWAPHADPLSSTDAEAGIRLLASALSDLRIDVAGVTGDLILGSYLASTAFAAAGSGMHHKICHVLGGAYDLPHAALHAVILPHVLAFNAPDDPRSAAAIARGLGGLDPVESLLALYDRIGAPRSLAELGFTARDIDDAAQRCLEAIPASNPRTVDFDSIRALLHAAWFGASPIVRSPQ